jgi:curli biogenesis system outer membrane secretion channel CsgG
MKKNVSSCPIIIVIGLCLMGCVSETHRSVEVHQTQASLRLYSGPRAAIAVGNFDNRSDFQRGIFSDGIDRLGGQAKTILINHLQQTNRFTVLDRDNMEETSREAGISGAAQELMGAAYLVSGNVTEFGRKEVTDYQAFGILGRGKSQIAYSKVSLNIVDVRTSAVVYSVQGAGEYELSDREVLGFGTSSSYDSTLNGKVLDLAIAEAVDKLAEGIDKGAWLPSGK